MLAYHNDQGIKDLYIARMKAHMEADSLIQGTGWDGERGRAVGCTFERYDHARAATEIGVPETLIRLEECIFENLPPAKAKLFRLAFLEAIPVGSDLSLTWPQFGLWLLSDPNHGAMRHCDDATRAAMKAVIGLYRRWVDGNKPPADEFGAAARSARVATEAAEAARAAARAGAEGGWGWATWAIRAAARAAVRAAEAAGAAGEGFWGAARDELLRLLREAPVSEEVEL